MLAKMSNLQQRLVVSALGVTAIILAVTFSNHSWFRLIFALLTAGVISVALWEYYHIAPAHQFQPLVTVGLLSTIAYVIAVYLRSQFSSALILPEIVLGLTLISAFGYYFVKGTDPFVNIAITLFGILYLTIPLSCIVEINYLPQLHDGRWALVYLLLVTKITDATAFFIGKWFGQRKLSPYISPKKTVEGFLGGIIGALVTSLVLYIVFHYQFREMPFPLTLGQSIWLALLLDGR